RSVSRPVVLEFSEETENSWPDQQANRRIVKRNQSTADVNQDSNIEKDLFAEALDLPPDQREGYLKGACRSDEQLRLRVEDLLRVHGDASRVLQTKGELRATLVNPPLDEDPGTIIDRYKLLQKIGEGG